MSGASSSADGKAGLVPQPIKGQQNYFLAGNGSWAIPTNTTYGLSGQISGNTFVATLGAASTGTTATIPEATADTAGLMTSAMVSKLAGIASGANKYVLPTASTTLGGVKTTSTVASTSGLTASPIISGVVYYKDTTYGAATTSTAGLMSAADKSKLDSISADANKYTLPVATTTTLGGIKAGGDITIDSTGVVSVKDDSHNHVISNVDGLSDAIQGAKDYADTAVANLVGSAPETLNTLEELAKAINNSPDIMTAINNSIATKQDKITGAATTITSSNLTAARVLVSNSSGKVAASSSITTTELGYLDGVTGAIQGQLDAKVATGSAEYIKGLSISGRTITYTKGDGTTGTLTTQDNNTTYKAGTGLTLTSGTFNHTNAVTAATGVGEDGETRTLAFGGTFKVPTVSYDAQGHITGSGVVTLTMPANPNSDTKVTMTNTDPSADTSWYLLGSSVSGTNTSTVLKNSEVRVKIKQGTADTTGHATLVLGNSIAAGTAGNKYGQLILFSANAGNHSIVGASSSSSYTHTLPTANGTLLNTGNYTSYTVKKDGTGASGDWGINITGSAASCTGNAATATKLATARTINSVSFDGSKNISFQGSYVSNTAYNTIPVGLSYIEMPATATVAGDPTYGAMLSVYMSAARAFQLVGDSSGNLWARGLHSSNSSDAGTGYGPWRRMLHDGNYTSYTVKKDGTGASGSWGINITGNAATATKLGTSDVGTATQPIYLDDGTPKACTYTLGKSVPSNAVFTDTDTKVTSVGNHYTPAADTSAALSVDASGGSAATWNSTQLVTGVNIQRDAKGHVVGVTVDSVKMPSNPNSNTTYTLSGAADGNTWKTTLTPSSGSATTSVVPAATTSAAGLMVGADKAKLDNIDTYATSIPFVAGTQTASTGTWTGVASELSELVDGQTIRYWLPYKGSGNATLNLTLADGTTTGAKNCYYGGTSRLTTHYPAGNIIILTYRENVSIAGSSTTYTGWWAQSDYDSNNYDRVRYQQAIKCGTTAIVAGNIIVGTGGVYQHLKSGAAFDITYPILYAGSAMAASATGNGNYLVYPFTITTTQSLTLTAYKPIFIKGHLSGTTFTPVSTAPLTQTVPTSADGYEYILLGVAYSTTAMYLLSEHPIFAYKGGAFGQISSKGITDLSVNGKTVTYTRGDGTTGTITTQDTTYSAATSSAAGLMSAADKAKLDGIASGATANTGDITGVTAGNGLTGGGSSGSVTLNVGAGSGITVAADTVSVNTSYTTSGKNYKVAVDSSSGGLYVNVPWTDTKNTAGSTNSDSKLFLIGATSQATNPQTYSDSEVYTTNGTLTAKTFSGSGAQLTNLREAYLDWGGRNFSGSYGPIDAAMIGRLGADRFAFGKPAGVTIEYSTNSGTTWTDYGATDAEKNQLFGSGGVTGSFIIGKNTTKDESIELKNYMLRVTIDTDAFKVYTTLNKFAIYVSTSGSTGCYCSIDAALESTPTTFVNFADKVSINGWSGWNIINTQNFTTYGNTAASQYGKLRFTFGCTGGNAKSYTGLRIQNIMGFGGMGHSTPSNMATHGHLYNWDASQNATFPAKVTASGGFSGSGASLTNLNASSISSGTIAAARLPKATTSALGAVMLGYSASGKNYAIQADSNGKLYVNVPWTDNNTTYTFTNKAVTLAWGTTSTIATVGGVDITVTMPANPDTNTHYTTRLYTGASGAVANAVATNPYLTVTDNNTYRNQVRFVGSGATTVKSDASGNITISSTNTTYSAFTGATSSAAGTAGLVPAPASGKTGLFLRSDGTWYDLIAIDGTTLDTFAELKAAWEGADSTLTTTLNNAIGAKQDKITGAATTITSSNLTANRALISNGSGKVAVSAVTSTELGYLDGVTSAIQTQLNARVSSVSASGTAPLTLNGSIASGKLTLTGSVANASTSAAGIVTTGAQSFAGLKTFSGGIFVNSASGTNPLTIARGGGTGESTKFYQDDQSLYIDMTNDETSCTTKFVYNATDSENGDGTNAHTATISMGMNSSGATYVTAGTFNGNASTASKLGTATLGSATQPIYLNSGTATKCSTYAGGTKVTFNGADKGASTASFYAPTGAGTAGYILKSNGTGAPTWLQTLPVANGGTGNTSMTANRLVWSESTSKLTAGYHYASSTKVAINSTSAPTETFYVNGAAKINGALTATSLNLTTIEKTMALSTQNTWYDTGIVGSNLATGTYIIQISRTDTNKTEYWSGIMSWCSTADSSPNATEGYDEIVLHNAGEYPGSVSHIMARTVRTTSGTKLQLCVSGTTMGSLKITFKCAKII